MHGFFPLSSLITTAAITPGPNNFIVFSRASTNGVWKTLPIITTIAASGAIMLCAIWSLTSFSKSERFIPYVGLVGSMLLAIMAVRQWRAAASAAPFEDDPAGLFTPLTVALVQPANPKTWILIAVVSSGARTAGITLAASVLLTTGISLACLLCWAGLGRFVKTWTSPKSELLIQRLLAVSLLGSAVDLSLTQLGALQ